MVQHCAYQQGMQSSAGVRTSYDVLVSLRRSDHEIRDANRWSGCAACGDGVETWPVMAGPVVSVRL